MSANVLPHTYHTNEQYENAVRQKSFRSLVPYPCLLFRWQMTHPTDLKRIATIASHRLNIHHWCVSSEICKTVGQFISDCTSVKQQVMDVG